jgi:hypothetical protein
MLWGLETLRNLNNTLLASLSEIRNAQESVYKYVKWVLILLPPLNAY